MSDYGIAADRLLSFVERIERIEEERRALGEDIKDIYAEAKSAGFDVKVMRRVIRERKLDQAELEEQEALLDLYRRALGQLVDTPLGVSAVADAMRDRKKASGRSVKRAVREAEETAQALCQALDRAAAH